MQSVVVKENTCISVSISLNDILAVEIYELRLGNNWIEFEHVLQDLLLGKKTFQFAKNTPHYFSSTSDWRS